MIYPSCQNRDWQQQKRARPKTSAKEVLVNQYLEQLHHISGQSLMLLSSNRRVLFTNQDAARFLGGTWLTVHKGFLRGKTPALEDELALAFANLSKAGKMEACALRTTSSVLFISIDTLRMTDENLSDARILVLRIHENYVAESINERFLKAWYNLSLTEAKLAAAFATGTSLSDFARRRKVSMTTVRSQFARIKLKLGARDQAELVSKVLVAMVGSEKSDTSLPS